ncbi:hypothetical protein ACHAXR_010702 [Thalassiosira sp. AJA248-18]
MPMTTTTSSSTMASSSTDKCGSSLLDTLLLHRALRNTDEVKPMTMTTTATTATTSSTRPADERALEQRTDVKRKVSEEEPLHLHGGSVVVKRNRANATATTAATTTARMASTTAMPAATTATTVSTASTKKGRWTAEEHRLFLQGYEQHGRNWKRIATMIKSRTYEQICNHAQVEEKKKQREKKKQTPEEAKKNQAEEEKKKQAEELKKLAELWEWKKKLVEKREKRAEEKKKLIEEEKKQAEEKRKKLVDEWEWKMKRAEEEKKLIEEKKAKEEKKQAEEKKKQAEEKKKQSEEKKKQAEEKKALLNETAAFDLLNSLTEAQNEATDKAAQYWDKENCRPLNKKFALAVNHCREIGLDSAQIGLLIRKKAYPNTNIHRFASNDGSLRPILQAVRNLDNATDVILCRVLPHDRSKNGYTPAKRTQDQELHMAIRIYLECGFPPEEAEKRAKPNSILILYNCILH